MTTLLLNGPRKKKDTGHGHEPQAQQSIMEINGMRNVKK